MGKLWFIVGLVLIAVGISISFTGSYVGTPISFVGGGLVGWFGANRLIYGHWDS